MEKINRLAFWQNAMLAQSRSRAWTSCYVCGSSRNEFST